MTEMRNLCKECSQIWPGWAAELDERDSDEGWYHIYVERIGLAGRWYWFTSCKAFSSWMDEREGEVIVHYAGLIS